MSNDDRKVKREAKIREIRDYITNERDTIVRRWACLQERIHLEDVRRDEARNRETRLLTRVLPITVQKFIRTLKKSVRKTMRNVGGTPYSIVRDMFLYWDARKIGMLNSFDLSNVLKALGVILPESDILSIVSFYDSGEGKNEMKYGDLLKDLVQGEPHILEMLPEDQETEEEKKMRFKTLDDKYAKKSKLVEQFLEAVKEKILRKMGTEGGNPFHHVRYSFLNFDWHSSDTLDPKVLCSCMTKNLNLQMSKEQATEIIDYYERRGHMNYRLLTKDISEGLEQFLTFTESTPRTVVKRNQSLARNPFTPVQFRAPPNKILEKFKRKVKLNLRDKVSMKGGTPQSWVRESFRKW